MGLPLQYIVGTFQTVGRRQHNEDRLKVLEDLNACAVHKPNPSAPPRAFFGCYDGHGGNSCADYCREELHNVRKTLVGRKPLGSPTGVTGMLYIMQHTHTWPPAVATHVHCTYPISHCATPSGAHMCKTRRMMLVCWVQWPRRYKFYGVVIGRRYIYA
jgi:hypothetical protein